MVSALRKRGLGALLARRGQAHGSGLGIYRWVVERTLAWLHQFRRLRVRWERRAEIHEPSYLSYLWESAKLVREPYFCIPKHSHTTWIH